MTVQLDEIIDKVEHLPVLPSTAVRVTEIATNPRGTIDDIVEVIRYDQNLTGRVLRLCNSSYFGMSRRIASLKEALAYLGAAPLLQLILGAVCSDVFQKPQPGYGLLRGTLWRHSSAVAFAGSCLARHVGMEKPMVLFTAGVLHDIGKTILDGFLGDTYQQVVDLLSETSLTFHEAEKQILGYSHAEVGELIMRRWLLPEEIIVSARYHHEPSHYTGGDRVTRQAVDLTHLADCLVLTMGIGVGNDGLRYAVDGDLARKYQLNEQVLDRIRVDTLTEIQRLERVYDMGPRQ